MPLFEFHCPSCNSRHELLCGHAELQSAPHCPDCGEAMVRQLTRPAAFRNSSPRAPGRTCCGREERCESPPCGGGGSCERG